MPPECYAADCQRGILTMAARSLRRRLEPLAAGALLLGVTVAAGAQRGFWSAAGPEPGIRNVRYDGRFAFARVKYTTGPGGYYYCGLPAWAHGYASCRGGNRAERSLMQIMTEISYLHPHVEESGIFALDDPELSRYPVAYMTEPGFWTMNDKEAAGLRAYLLKGGFIIFDDFRADGQFNSGGGWANFEGNMRRAIPSAQFVEIDATRQIFHSFFEIDNLDIVPQSYDRGRPAFFGLFEDNDPKKRMMAIVNHSTDVSDFWEFSGTGFRPISESNEAYKLGVNYIIYGLTH
jgi:hypothetical protein